MKAVYITGSNTFNCKVYKSIKPIEKMILEHYKYSPVIQKQLKAEFKQLKEDDKTTAEFDRYINLCRINKKIIC